MNDANEEVTELKQMLEEAGEAFTEKEAEISKLKAALDEEEACIKKQVGHKQEGYATISVSRSKNKPINFHKIWSLSLSLHSKFKLIAFRGPGFSKRTRTAGEHGSRVSIFGYWGVFIN